MNLNYNNSDEFDEEYHKPKRGKSSLSGLYFARLANPKYIKEAHTSKRPQAVFKIVSFARGHRVKNLISYLARAKEAEEEKRLDVEDSDGVLHESLDADQDIYTDWKKDFERAKPGSKRPPRHAVHLLFSSAVKNTPQNARKTLIAAKRTAEECFGKAGYKYAVVLHTDTAHPHAHIVVNLKNIDPEKRKLKINKPDIFGIRYKFAENLNKQDLYHSATLKHDRPAFVAKAAKNQAVVIENKNWFASKLKTASLAGDVGSDETNNDFESKKNVSRAVYNFRKDIKKEKSRTGTGKTNTLDVIRALEKSMLDPKKNIGKEIDKAMKLIGQDARRFRKYLDEFREAKTAEKKKNSYTVIKKMRENIYKSIEVASDVVRDMPLKDKKRVLESLELHKKLMQGKIRLKEVKPIEKDFKKAVEKYEKEAAEFEKRPKEVNFAKEFLKRKEFERFKNEHLKNVERFKQEIRISKAPIQDKNRTLNFIRDYQKGMGKRIGIELRR